ncbi:MAG: hypothetical protein U1F42_09585 [Candidatus Competibacteraceae bacterium]
MQPTDNPAPLSQARSARDNEMSGEADEVRSISWFFRSPGIFIPEKINKIIKFQRTCAAAVAYPHQRLLCARPYILAQPIFVIFSIFLFAYPWGVGKDK